MLMEKFLVVRAEKRRPAGKTLSGKNLGMRHRDSARQSCTDEAEAAVLTALNEGVGSFHAFNPNHWGERWQACGKN
ncbi:hypothetical protein CCU68_17365 [Pseudomonas gingeri NCPPB 3146 = LMG 5327]|uniref:Uncharacterized protein n=1 Tax=Pseudomonas gingeri NCPPB 3146 = LMG 5327 TaxID=707248 RepID=A0ABX4Y1R5_9PSED|nr:hypothetical protein CCU68_17365 [Pseudomonas gingeri NCPPB 3146 = LMG 5327]